MKTLIASIVIAASTLLCSAKEEKKEVYKDVVEFCNTATQKEITEVKGFGNVLASRLIEARPFKHSSDVRKVKGIGEVKFLALVKHTDERAE